MKSIINDLNTNPIFKMSLGSKELFHSNFLEYLWDLDRNAFISMINSFLPANKLNPTVEYILGREKENFDLCIYQLINNKCVYDLVIENKVKSIPYKEQLLDYKKKANNNRCRYILLTLSEDFPDKGDPSIDNWIIIGYDKLKRGIEKYYHISGHHSFYIKDYCAFIENLVDLKDVILPKNDLCQQILFNENDIKELETIRLHDLYIKLRCSWFVLELKRRLQVIKPIIVHKFPDRKTNAVNLNVDINQGNGQIAAWICDNKGNVFEIVIQGNQYRHGINQIGIGTKAKDRYYRLNELYSRLLDLPDKNAYSFLNFYGSNDVEPKTNKLFQKTKISKQGPFNCYDESYLYRYIKVENKSIGDLLNYMINDIKNIYNNIPNLYK